MPKALQLRTIVEEPEVSEQVDSFARKNIKVQAAFDALKWRLSHKPESGQPVGIGGFYVLSSSTDKQPDVRLVVLYRFDDNEVTIHRIKIELR